MEDQLPPKTSLRQGRYIVEALYKKGGQAMVYRGYDTEGKRPVIIKQTDGERGGSNKALEYEAEILGQLSHPALPQVIDIFEEQGRACLVMSYVPGRDMSELMKSRGSAFAVAEVAGWAEQLFDILEYLQKHDAAIIHRDINPKNIRLTPDNRISLLDFGIAKKSLSKTLLVGGTPHYAPPEQLKDEGTDHRSDIYSLAATLYYLLTAVEPPDALSRAASTLKGLPDPLVPARELNCHIPQHISEALLESMSLDREDRPADARAFRHMLNNSDWRAEEAEIPTVVSQRRVSEAERSAAKSRIKVGVEEGTRAAAVKPSRLREATPEARRLLEDLQSGADVPDDLLLVLVELLDSPPESRPKVLRLYASLLEHQKKEGASAGALELARLLADNYPVRADVRAQLRQHLSSLMGDRMLSGLSGERSGGRNDRLVLGEELVNPEDIPDPTAQREWLRGLLVWVVRGVLIAAALQVGFRVFAGERTVVDVLLMGAARSVLWATLFLCAYTLAMLALIRALGPVGEGAKRGHDSLFAAISFGYGLTFAAVLLHDLFALMR